MSQQLRQRTTNTSNTTTMNDDVDEVKAGDCGQHLLAALVTLPSKICSVPVSLNDLIMNHIIRLSS